MARTESIVAVVRKIESARAALAAVVEVKQRELADLDAALRRVLGDGGGGGGGGATTPNGRARRASGRRGGRRGRGVGGAPRAGTLGAHILAAVHKAEKTVGIPDVMKAIRSAGYKSSAKAKTQAVMVAQTLSRLVRGGHISKKGRGKYAAMG